MKVLIVDDDPKFRRLMQSGMAESGLHCSAAADADEALDLLQTEGPDAFDAILLDVMLPGRSGWDFLTDLRSEGVTTPVIFVTARHEVEERVKGLRLGADDYVIKPFELAELLARLEAIRRRQRMATTLVIGDLRIDVERRVVERAGRRIEMSPREFELLHVLAKNVGRVLSRAELLHEVWGIDFDPGTNVVNVLVARLRRKVDRDGEPMIHTVVGSGYKLADPGEADA